MGEDDDFVKICYFSILTRLSQTGSGGGGRKRDEMKIQYYN